MKTSVLIIESRFYDDIADELVKGAIAELEARGVAHERVSVPGALEIPVALSLYISNGRVDIGMFEEDEDDDEPVTVDGKVLPSGVIALGCVIRGETSHYDIVANESARSLLQLATEYSLPLGNGILTVDSREQAMARARVDGRNKGRDAAAACLRLMEIKRATASSLIDRFESL